VLGFTGFFALVLLATRIPLLSRILAHPKTLALLAIPHTWRIGGITFLTVMALGHLPAVFALPAGLGDIAIGLAAPFIARRLARGDRRGAVRFHVLGIVDLIVALTIGFLAGLGPFRPFAFPSSPRNLTPPSCNCIPPFIAIQSSCRRVATCWWWVPATPAQRSPWSWPLRGGRTCRGGTPDPRLSR
jgi:hypothetical protein